MPRKFKSKYRAFCETAPDLPVYMHAFYLDAVCEKGEWDVAVIEKGGKIVAAWPYLVKKKLGLSYVVMPVLGRLMGPYLAPSYRNSTRENSMLEELLNQFPYLAAFEQDFNYQATNWLPLFWRKYEQSTRYSYVLDVTDLSYCWNKIAPDYRNQKIPKAREILEVSTGDDLAEFYRVHNLSYARQGKKAPFTFEFLSKLDQALATRGQRAIFFAKDRDSGVVHGVAYLIWDRQSSYFLMAGDDPALRKSGAGVLLAWEAIQYTHAVLKLSVFDFAGSMVKAIERVRRQFGARQIPYLRVSKTWSPFWKWAKYLRRF
jgi:hypothetical protein